MKKCAKMLWKSQINKSFENTIVKTSFNKVADFSLKNELFHGYNLTILSKPKEQHPSKWRIKL